MPRNGSGTYSPPVGTTAVTNTTIKSPEYNAFVADIGSEMTDSMPRAGTASMTAAFPFGGFRGTSLGAATALDDAIQAQQVLNGSVQSAADSGAADAYVLTLAPVPTAYTNKMRIWFSTANANTGASTLDVNGLGAQSIVKNVSDALESGDIPANKIVDVIYDGTNFVMQNPSDSALSTASTTEVLTGTDTAKAVTPDALAALWEKGSDIASAATISVGEGGYFDITGSVTIVDIDVTTDKSGREFEFQFDGTPTITHGSNLVLPGAANIVAAAGDIARFRSEDGADKIVCTNYQRAASGPGGSALTEYDMGAYTTGTLYQQAHSLGSRPSLDQFNVALECTTSDRNYSIGDRIEAQGVGSGGRGATKFTDATNIEWRSGQTVPEVVNKTTFVAGSITASSWKVILLLRTYS